MRVGIKGDFFPLLGLQSISLVCDYLLAFVLHRTSIARSRRFVLLRGARLVSQDEIRGK